MLKEDVHCTDFKLLYFKKIKPLSSIQFLSLKGGCTEMVFEAYFTDYNPCCTHLLCTYCRRSHLEWRGGLCLNAICDCSLCSESPEEWRLQSSGWAGCCWCGPGSVTLTSHEGSNSVRLSSSVATTAQERNSHNLPGSFTNTATSPKQHLQLMHIVIFHHYRQPMLLEETSKAWF